MSRFQTLLISLPCVFSSDKTVMVLGSSSACMPSSKMARNISAYRLSEAKYFKPASWFDELKFFIREQWREVQESRTWSWLQVCSTMLKETVLRLGTRSGSCSYKTFD